MNLRSCKVYNPKLTGEQMNEVNEASPVERVVMRNAMDQRNYTVHTDKCRSAAQFAFAQKCLCDSVVRDHLREIINANDNCLRAMAEGAQCQCGYHHMTYNTNSTPRMVYNSEEG
jgi:hypothetical protein